MDWFDDQTSAEKKVAVKNAVLVMMADGKIDEKELAFLGRVCARVGVSPSELKDLLESISQIRFTVPETEKERVCQLMDMVFMMLVDGHIDAREMELCLELGRRLGFPASMISTIVKAVTEAIQKGGARAQVAVEVNSYLGK